MDTLSGNKILITTKQKNTRSLHLQIRMRKVLKSRGMVLNYNKNNTNSEGSTIHVVIQTDALRLFVLPTSVLLPNRWFLHYLSIGPKSNTKVYSVLFFNMQKRNVVLFVYD